MFNYSDEVIYYLKESKEIANSFNSKYVEVIHLVLAIISHDNNITNILKEYNCDYDSFKKYINKSNKKIDISFYSNNIKRIVDSSLESLKEYKTYLLTEDILFLNILEDNNYELINILNKFNIDVRTLYNQVKDKVLFNECSMLLKYGDVLNNKLSEDERVYGRDKEINNIIEVLARKKKNNPLLIGESGVGKTAIVEELARRIKEKSVPTFLYDYKIISIPISTIVGGSKYRGEFEEKLESIIKECERSKNIILFIDEIHTVIGAGGAEGAIDASNILKPALARSNIKLIGATTKEEYNKFIRQEKAFERRFNIIEIKEPSKSEVKYILSLVKKEYELFHKVIINEDVIDYIINNSKSILPNRFEPDRSIDVLDRVCTYVSINKCDNKLDAIIDNKIKSLKEKDYDKAINLKKKENYLKNNIKYKEVTINDLNSVFKSNIIVKSSSNIGFCKEKRVFS